MVKSKAANAAQTTRRGLWIILVILGLALSAGWYFHIPVQGFAKTATAYSARVACSCRYVAGRSLEDCGKDKPAGTEFVTLVEDSASKSVTARFPLLASDKASFREGYGCVLQPWEG